MDSGSAASSAASNALLWTVTDVVAWLVSGGFAPAAELARGEEIDGAALLELTDSDIRESLGVQALERRKALLRAVRALLPAEYPPTPAMPSFVEPAGVPSSSGFSPAASQTKNKPAPMRNVGSSCFVNATLQGLFSLSPVRTVLAHNAEGAVPLGELARTFQQAMTGDALSPAPEHTRWPRDTCLFVFHHPQS